MAANIQVIVQAEFLIPTADIQRTETPYKTQNGVPTPAVLFQTDRLPADGRPPCTINPRRRLHDWMPGTREDAVQKAGLVVRSGGVLHIVPSCFEV